MTGEKFMAKEDELNEMEDQDLPDESPENAEQASDTYDAGETHSNYISIMIVFFITFNI